MQSSTDSKSTSPLRRGLAQRWLGKRVTAHTLRNTAAMRLLEAGVDMPVIALWLGHEQVATIYLHAHLAIKERALAKVPIPQTPIS